MTSRLGSLLGFILLSVGSIVAKGATPVILSTDIGNEIDDQWAIAYLMLDPHFKVLGLISAHAPSIPDPAGYNSYVLLRDEVENQLNMSTHPPILAGGDNLWKIRKRRELTMLFTF